MLTDDEKKVIALLQTDIPVVSRPYKQMADTIGMTEDRFLNILRALSDRGMIRRFGATLKHQKSGFKANAMVAWKVAEERVEEVGCAMAEFDEITHCYRRDPAPGWDYNLYTMIHAADRETCRQLADTIARTVGEDTFTLLFSEKELKKTSMRYFDD